MGTNVDKIQNMGKTYPHHPKIDNLMDIIRLRLIHKLTYKEIAKQLGVSKQGVYARYKQVLSFFDPNNIKEFEIGKADILSGVEQVVLNNMLDTKTLKKASFNNLAYGLGTINNINRLHRGLSTSNVSVNSLTASLSEIVEEEKKLQKQLEDRK